MKKLFWIDLEMTGLDVNKETIIEVGVIITDLDFQPLETYHTVVKQPESYLLAMDDWNKKHHGASGLLQEIPSGRDPAVVEAELIALSDRHFRGEERAVLAGNSIAQDRLFITKYFPKFNDKLHYRMLDVTAWKIMMKSKFNIAFTKGRAHRSIQDIEESIKELKHYLSFIKIEATAEKR